METKTFEISAFKRVVFRDWGILKVTQGDVESLTVDGDENCLDRVHVSVTDDTLTIGFKGEWFNRITDSFNDLFSGRPWPKPVYHLTVRELDSVRVSGQCDFYCQSLKVDQLDFKVEGLADVDLLHLQANTLKLHIGGRSDFEAVGDVDVLSVRIDGSGELQSERLNANTVNLVINGQGRATLRAAQVLDVVINGVGDVNYYGDPKVSPEIHGIGNINHLGA